MINITGHRLDLLFYDLDILKPADRNEYLKKQANYISQKTSNSSNIISYFSRIHKRFLFILTIFTLIFLDFEITHLGKINRLSPS